MAALADALVLVAALWALLRARSLLLGDLAWRGGLALVAIAAAVGAVRYAVAPALAPLHGVLSSVAETVGMPLMAVGLLARSGLARREQRGAGFASVGLAGAALATIAALVVGDTGEWHGIARETVFHVLFATSLVCFGAAYQLARARS
jgi:hypothetical protein